MAVVVVNGTDSIDQWRAKTNTISTQSNLSFIPLSDTGILGLAPLYPSKYLEASLWNTNR